MTMQQKRDSMTSEDTVLCSAEFTNGVAMSYTELARQRTATPLSRKRTVRTCDARTAHKPSSDWRRLTREIL